MLGLLLLQSRLWTVGTGAQELRDLFPAMRLWTGKHRARLPIWPQLDPWTPCHGRHRETHRAQACRRTGRRTGGLQAYAQRRCGVSQTACRGAQDASSHSPNLFPVSLACAALLAVKLEGSSENLSMQYLQAVLLWLWGRARRQRCTARCPGRMSSRKVRPQKRSCRHPVLSARLPRYSLLCAGT